MTEMTASDLLIIRKKLKMTQKEFALALGYDLVMDYREIEHGKKPIPKSNQITAEILYSSVSTIKSKKDMVNHPPHYTAHPSGVECIQITEHMGFNLGNAFKYIWRADLKNGVEDLEKAAWYINREIKKRNKDA